MSASLFDSWGSYSCPTNYLDYNDGDKKFSELQSGDVVYYHGFDTDDIQNIIEFVIKSKGIKKRKDTAYLSIEPVRFNKYFTMSQLQFGPVYGSAMFGKINGDNRTYSFSNIADSSACVSSSGQCVFGTNREFVLEIAKMHIASRMEDIRMKVENLNKDLNKLSNNLENLI